MTRSGVLGTRLTGKPKELSDGLSCCCEWQRQRRPRTKSQVGGQGILPPRAVRENVLSVREHPSCVPGELTGNLREISPKPNSTGKGQRLGHVGDFCPMLGDFGESLGSLVSSGAEVASQELGPGGLIPERPVPLGVGAPGLCLVLTGCLWS